MPWGNVAQCEQCWIESNTHYDNGEMVVRIPIRVSSLHVTLEACDDCGKPTISGIYIRKEITIQQKQFMEMFDL